MRSLIGCVLGLGVMACSSKESPVPADTSPTADATELTAGELPRRAASSICGALFRCCDDDLEEYFAPYRANELLEEFHSRLPPAGTLDEASCRDVLELVLDRVPLGDWVRAAAAGTVEYDPAAAASCLAGLDAATCGSAARAALWDSRCFGFAPPSGGDVQRSFVRRVRGVDETCAPIRDGIGAALYGTCDPRAAFCCYEAPGQSGCQYPFEADGTPRAGRCAAVSAVDETCAVTAPLKLCATGVDCDGDTLRCVATVEADLAVGDECVDAGFHVLGTCQGSFCDVLGSRRCEPLRPDGQACIGGDECQSGSCASVCVPMTLCTGTSDAPPMDAGTDAGVDATPRPDAATTDPERCETAPELAAVSVASPLAGYTARVSGSFGLVDDYNPLLESEKPPHCAFAYDAIGRDVAYAITLAPGERLLLRAELVDGKQAAIYVLDTCPEASWPDFDGSGACGSNEYNAGFCGPVGCEPTTLDLRYPAAIAGQPTSPARFWVVIDQVAGTASTGFVLDWKLVPAP